MRAKDNNLTDVDVLMDERYGREGSPEREIFRKEAYAYCMGQVILDARKQEKVTQEELANRIGATRSYISRIENGLIDPSVSTFYRIMEALGLRIEIVKPVM
jgi:Predicted transcriptional regulator with C-terminal CBS domains